MGILIVAAGLVGTLLYFAHAACIPIALSVLFALLLSGPVEALNQKGLPRSVSALLILLVFLTVAGGAVNFLWSPAQAWLTAAPRTFQIIQRKISPAARFMQRLDAVSDRASHLADNSNTVSATPKTAPPPAPAPNEPDMLAQVREALVSAVTVVILTLFLLAAGPPVLARMTAAFAKDTHATHVLQVIEAIRGEVGRYYATIALINLGLAVATWLVMTLIGMPNPMLWGAVAGVLNFIPYVGSATTFAILTIVAFVSFDGISPVFAVAGGYLTLATIEGQVIQPWMVGHRLELNPIIVFLALWFGGWFWGIAGIVLAIPSLVALKVAAENSEGGMELVEFLSPNKAKRFKARRVGSTQRSKASTG